MRTNDKEKTGFTYDPKKAIKTILHAQACVAAIESIGGDPATVGELVKAADKLVPFMEDTIGSKTVRIYAADRIRIKVLLKLLTETKVTP